MSKGTDHLAQDEIEAVIHAMRDCGAEDDIRLISKDPIRSTKEEGLKQAFREQAVAEFTRFIAPHKLSITGANHGLLG
jgi:hypothetical protein